MSVIMSAPQDRSVPTSNEGALTKSKALAKSFNPQLHIGMTSTQLIQ
jgi:hypothetical protein